MKHFLRLLCIGSVLFVVLGLFRQTQDHADPGGRVAAESEPGINCSGILSQHQELPPPVSFSIDSPPPASGLNVCRKFQENLYSIQLNQQREHSDLIFNGIKPDILQKTGLYLYYFSRQEMLS